MKTIRKHPILQSLILLILMPAFVTLPTSVQSNPSGEIVIHGDVEFESVGDTLRIMQESSKSIIHWENFSIGSGQQTIFEMPGSSSASLNRVTGSSLSAIDGLLQANGHVWVINPNGIIVGPNGRIDASGAVLSTLDINDNDFLHGNGEYHFFGTSTAPVINYGTIQTADKGSVYVVAHNIQNDGHIGAPDGRVVFAGGSDILISSGPNGNVMVNSALNGGAHILNNGTVEGAEVQLAARGGNPLAVAIQHNGMTRATTAEKVGGKVLLSATNGAVNVAAGSAIDASGEVAGGNVDIRSSDGGIVIGGLISASSSAGFGGGIGVNGATIEFLPGSSTSAAGAAGGGSVQVGSAGLDGNPLTDAITVHPGANVDANSSAGAGGDVRVTATGMVIVGGGLSASGATSGGSTNLAANDLLIPETGAINVSGGDTGGSVAVHATNNMYVDGTIDAGGGTGRGGDISLSADDNLLVSETGLIGASGKDGGTISLGAGAELFIAGQVDASGTDGRGGDIHLGGENITVAPGAVVGANGTNGGGTINVAASDTANIFGTLSATGGDGAGGTIGVSATNILVGPTGVIDAGGATGGTVTIAASDTATILGTVQAIGSTGGGGTIGITGTDVVVGPTAVVDASGVTGGTVLVDASNTADISGTIRATGSDGSGGLIGITGHTITVNPTAVIDGGGATGGGQVFIGGGIQGRDSRFRNAQNVTIAPGAQISANATSSGDGGVIAFWSDGAMNYAGDARANGAGQVGNGGFVEVSGRNLSLGGAVSTGAAGTGRAGTFLIDPVNVTINAAAAGLIVGAMATANVIIHTAPIGIADPGEAGNITIQDQVHVDYNSVNSLSFFAHGDFIMDRSASIRNGGSGNINVVAGWNPGALDLAVLFNQPGLNQPVAPGSQSHVDIPAPPLGGHVGSIAAADILAGTFGTFGVGGAGQILFRENQDPDTTAVIGSAHGETNIFGGSLTMETGNDREGSQIGWNTLNNELRNVGGTVNPQLLNQDQTNFTVGNRTVYGYDAGDTTINLFGGTTLPGIGDTFDFGHGGGVYTVTAVDGSSFTLDRGLDASVGSGSALIVAGVGTNDFVTATEERNNPNAGNINVHTTGLIRMRGGSNRSGVQIGHGGNVRDWQSNQAGDLNGDITIRSGNLIMESGTERFDARVGHGGTNDDWGGNQPVQTFNRTGNIDVESTGGILMRAGTRKAAVVIGHNSDRINGNSSGDIRVVARNALVMTAAQGTADNRQSYVQIGNGGFNHAGNAFGHIDVSASAITMTAGDSDDNFVMIGNGGRSVRGEHWGNISVEATSGSITAQAGNAFGDTSMLRTFVQIGNGGYDGDHLNARPAENPLGPNGAGTTVGEEMTTVDVLNAQNAAEGGRHDDITAMIERSPFLFNALGQDVYRRVGSAGNISVIAAGAVLFRAGGAPDSHAQIGHGGRDTIGAHGTWDVDNADGDNDWYTGADGDITVIANSGGVVFDRFVHQGLVTGERSQVQIGHGGYQSFAGAQGEIRVEAHNGNVEMHGGTQDDAYAQIGHGGRQHSWGHGDTTDTAAIRHARAKNDTGAAGVLEGDITVLATGDIIFRSGFADADRAYSQIGHGGYSAYAPPHMGHNGDITVSAGGNIDFYAGRRNNPDHELGQDDLLPGMTDRSEAANGNVNWTAIGHVTYDRGHSNPFGDITINAGTNPFVGSAVAARSNAFVSIEATGGWDGIGYADDQANANNAADDYPTFNTGHNASLTGDNNFAFIGHGGFDFDHVNEGDDPGQSGSNFIGVGALGYWWDPLTGQHVAGTIIGTRDDGSSAGSIAGDRLADVSADNNAHSTNGNDTLRTFQAGYADDNTRGRGWVIPRVGLNPLNLLDPVNAAFASNIATSNISVTATGDVRVVGAQFDPTNPMKAAYIEAGARNVAGILPNTRDQDDVLTLFNTSRTMSTNPNSTIFTTPSTFAVPLNLVQSARQSWAMIGHGGMNSGQRAFGPDNSGLEAGYGYYGDITVNAGGEVKVVAGDFVRELAPGEAPDTVTGTTQYDFDGDGVGALPLYRPFDIANGNAGNNSTALNDVPQGSVDSRDQWAMIGHGGVEFSSHVRGDIAITSTGGGLEVSAGNSFRSFAQVGHGGEGWNVGHQSKINVAQDVQGTISIDVTGDVTVTAGQSTFAFAQIGHGGVEFRDDDDPNTALSNGDNNFDVDAFTVTNSDISVISRMGGVTIRNRAEFDGLWAQPQYDFADNPDIIRLNASSMLQDGIAHAVIGHGSYDGEVKVGEVIDDVYVGGNITVRAEGGDVRIGAPVDTVGNPAMAPMNWRSPMQIGHFMSFSDRTPPDSVLSLLGNIDVYAAGDVTLRGGDSPRLIADIQQQRTHGARDGINIYSAMDAADDSYSFEQSITNSASAMYYPLDIDTQEFDAYAQIGHGGMATGSWAGRGTLVAAGNITVTADRADDPLTVGVNEAANIVLDAGDGTGAFAMIGHGGRRAQHPGDITGNITVNASNDIFLIGGERFINGGISGFNFRNENKENWATIGHNIQTETTRTGNASGNIIVNAGRDLTLQAGLGDSAHARIGNGSNFNYLGVQNHSGNFLGNIDIQVGRDLLVRGGDINNGLDTDPGPLGDGLRNIFRAGFSVQEDWPGYGGFGEDALVGELGTQGFGPQIALNSAPDDTYAQIGNGGNGVVGVMQGNININVGNNATLERGWTAITLASATGPFRETSAFGGSVKIGHGDWLYDSPGSSGSLTREGNISLNVGNDLTVNGAMIGHTDPRVSAAIPIAGETLISTGRAGTGGNLNIDSASHRRGSVGTVGSVDVGTLADTGFGVSVFTSALGGQLRFYVPEHSTATDNLNIAAGSLFNGSGYVPHAPHAPTTPLTLRSDELEQVEFGFTFANPGGNFTNDLPQGALTPLGLYTAHGFGDYKIYVGGVPVVAGPPVVIGPGGGGGGDDLPFQEEVRINVVPPVVVPFIPAPTQAIPPVPTGLTAFQLFVVDAFFGTNFLFEQGRGLGSSGVGEIGEDSAPGTDGIDLDGAAAQANANYLFGDGVQFSITGGATPGSADPYQLLQDGGITIWDLITLLARQQQGLNGGAAGPGVNGGTDGSNGTIDPFSLDPDGGSGGGAGLDPFSMDPTSGADGFGFGDPADPAMADEDDDEKEMDNSGGETSTEGGGVNTNGATPPPAGAGEFDF